uniref:NAD dependent epimerase/dehydratase n=1 Tax=Rhizophora mucronata TaxID=61149 RepID=A0A2P2KUG3_RHIMU
MALLDKESRQENTNKSSATHYKNILGSGCFNL